MFCRYAILIGGTVVSSCGYAERPLQVSLCDVIRHPESYEGRLVEMRVEIPTVAVHVYMISDSHCPEVTARLKYREKAIANGSSERVEQADWSPPVESPAKKIEATVVGVFALEGGGRERVFYADDVSDIKITVSSR